jgi:hypothetical protein
MKKILFLSFILSIFLLGYTQQGIKIPRVKSDVAQQMIYQNAVDDGIGLKNPFNPTVSNPNSAKDEAQIGTTWYDLQTNAALGNRLYLHPDNSISAVWTMSQDAVFNDRGTGYNYYNGSSWGPGPTARIENIKTGWPTVAPWGANGEIIVAHTGVATGLYFNKRETKGTGAWVSSYLEGPDASNVLVWPRMITSGTNHNVIHVISCGGNAVTYNGQTPALLYNRSFDGGITWSPFHQVIDQTGPDYYNNINADEYTWANPVGNTIAFCVVDQFKDWFVMKSTNAGDTWEKIVIWEHPYPFFSFPDGLTVDTLWSPDGSGDVALDVNGNVHAVCGLTFWYKYEVGTTYSFFPGSDGIIYWNESMPPFTAPNQHDALDPLDVLTEANYVGWSQDVNNNGILEVGSPYTTGIYSYRSIGLSTMPNIAISPYGEVYLVYASTTEGYTYGNPPQYNFKHVWNRTSNDFGETWGDFTDVTGGLIYVFSECVYPGIAKNTNDKFHIYFQVDDTPGLAIDADHPAHENQMVYFSDPITTIGIINSFPYSQSFESGIGEWIQSADDNFNWTVYAAATPTSNTGPDNAYDGNYYIYTESSSPNYPNKTAGIYATFDFSSLLNPNLSFWYHMYGSTMGTLKVQVSTNNGNTWSDLWTKTGNQGNLWSNAVVNLSGYSNTNNIKLRFWGITGSNQYSDLAVDYIEVTGILTPDIEVNPLSLTIYESNKKKKTESNIKEILTNVDLVFKEKINKKFIIDTIIDGNDTIFRISVPGYPPENYKAPIASSTKTSVILPNTPAYDWSFGCSATSAAMMAGFYDNNGFPAMYSGPANGGIAPMNNSIWGSVTINGEVRKQCPISATRQGVDGRAIYGHVDDYWILYGSTDPDPYIGNWSQHTYGDCTGDYMKTNQSNYSNSDGSTSYYYMSDGSAYASTYSDDGCYGQKLFFESRGYTVDEYYTQLIYGYNGNTLGFTFNQFKQEIDAGRPVLIHVEGHTMLGYGYDDNNSNIYIHDTWDYSDHQMVWGGDYSGLNQWGVGVFHLSGGVPFNNDEFVISNVGNAVLSISSIYENLPWLNTTGYPITPFNIDPGNGQNVVVNIDWVQVGDITQSGTITINSDDPDEPVVNVSVTAIPILVPSLIINPIAQPVPSGSGSFQITVNSNIVWTVNESCGWLSCNPAGGTSNGQFTVTYDENTSINPRTCIVTVSGSGVNASCTVTQAGAAPALTISPATQNVTANSGSFPISVNSNISWNVSESCTWVSCSPISGTGSGQITVNYNANTSMEPRICTITVSGNGMNETCILTQNGAAPYLTISPTIQNVSAVAGSFQITVTSNTTWVVNESCNWLSCNPAGGAGNGQFTVNYDENTGINPRTCTITVSASGINATCMITQSGAAPNLSINPIAQNVNSSFGSFQIIVTSNTSWSVSESCGWLSCNPSGGTGNGQFTVNYDENTSINPRICNVTVSGSGINATCIVTQEGAAPYIEINPPSQNVSSVSGNFQIDILSNITWVASENCNWLSCSPLNGTGNGQVIVNYDANPDLNPRTCTITIEGNGIILTCIVSQDGASEILTIDPASWNASAGPGSFTINVTSNINWQVDEICDWLSCYPISGNGNGQFTVNYDENTSISPRICTITVNGSGLNANCEVVQDGITSVPEYGSSGLINLYPNPFKTAINVHYILPEECKFTLALYTLIGNKIKEATWISKSTEEKEISLPVADLPSGIYFYSIDAVSIDGNRFYKTSGKMIKK